MFLSYFNSRSVFFIEFLCNNIIKYYICHEFFETDEEQKQVAKPINRDIPKIIKFKATNLLRVSCLFCIFKHSPKKRFDGQNWGNLN